VFGQVAVIRKNLVVTHNANIWGFSAVSPQMFLQTAAPRKCSRTDFTRIGFIAAMCSNVLHQSAVRRERHQTNVTRVRRFSTVSSHMHRQIAISRERFCTNLTGIRVFSAVRSHVCRQFVLSRERFRAHFARIRFAFCASKFHQTAWYTIPNHRHSNAILVHRVSCCCCRLFPQIYFCNVRLADKRLQK